MTDAERTGHILRGLRAMSHDASRDSVVSRLKLLSPPISISVATLAGIEAGTTDAKLSWMRGLLRLYNMPSDLAWALICDTPTDWPVDINAPVTP